MLVPVWVVPITCISAMEEFLPILIRVWTAVWW